jgi:DNA-binding transcriptional LysR family regulator
VVGTVEGIELALGQNKSSPAGHVRVAAPVSLGIQLMKCVPVLLARHPGPTVEVVVRDDLGDMVEDRLDLAVTVGDILGVSLIKRGLSTSTRVSVAAPD